MNSPEINQEFNKILKNGIDEIHTAFICLMLLEGRIAKLQKKKKRFLHNVALKTKKPNSGIFPFFFFLFYSQYKE